MLRAYCPVPAVQRIGRTVLVTPPAHTLGVLRMQRYFCHLNAYILDERDMWVDSAHASILYRSAENFARGNDSIGMDSDRVFQSLSVAASERNHYRDAAVTGEVEDHAVASFETVDS